MPPITHHHPTDHQHHADPTLDGRRQRASTHPGGTTIDDHAGHDRHAGHGAHGEVFQRLFWWNLLLAIPVVVSSEMVQEWFGYELTFWGADAIAPVLGSVFLWSGVGRSWPAAGSKCATPAGDDAADRGRDQRRIRGIIGGQAGSRRPRVLVGARGVDGGHAARPLAGDACDRTGPRRPRRAGRAATRRRRTRHWRRARPRAGV